MMATIGTLLPLLLFAFAIMSGVLLDGVNGDSAFVSRREAVQMNAPPPPAAVCTKHSCQSASNPDCCINPGGALFCTNFKTNSGSCGGCTGKCSPLGGCCDGVCTDNQNDPNNCGGCGYTNPKYICHAPKKYCVNSMCSSHQ